MFIVGKAASKFLILGGAFSSLRGNDSELVTMYIYKKNKFGQVWSADQPAQPYGLTNSNRIGSLV